MDAWSLCPRKNSRDGGIYEPTSLPVRIPSRASWRRLRSTLKRTDQASTHRDELEALARRIERLEASVGRGDTDTTPSIRDGIIGIQRRLDRFEQLTFERLQRALGRVESRQIRELPLELAAFQVFSQDAEDGLLVWLSRLVPVEQRFFVEFGIESYVESNTRFLLLDHGWEGLILDADAEHIRSIRRGEWYLAQRLSAEAARLTAENADEVLRAYSRRRVGLLSIDIDGNDWWVWEAITAVDPVVVVVEYNAVFGPVRSVTVPYAPDFDRRVAHPSWIYFGASLAALERLGRRKGYVLVATSPSGVNAFFVRRDMLPPELPRRSAVDLWRPCRFSESRDATGTIVKVALAEQQALVEALPLVEIDEAGLPVPND